MFHVKTRLLLRILQRVIFTTLLSPCDCVFQHHVEASETRGTTAMVYLQLHSSLYTGTVHVLSSVAGVHRLVWPPTRGVGRCHKTPRGDGLAICPFEKGARWAWILVARNNAQSCSTINQIPIISQFVSQKNQTSVCGKMHSRGSGMCGESRWTERGPAAN